jgi:tetratricopeptide (TPR) repeat protein
MLCLLWTLLAAGANTPSVQHQRGVELYKQQKYADAISVLQEVVKDEKPDTVDYKESVLLIGQSYFMLSQAPKAIPWLEKVPTVNEANYMLGYAYLQAKQLDQSEIAFARLFNIKADTAQGHLVAAQMMLKKEYEEQAAVEAKKALTLDAKLPGAHFLLGEMHIFRGELDEAIIDLNAELALNPDLSMAWYRLGDAYTRKEAWDLAVPELQRAVWLNPEFSGPYILLGKCYFKQSNFSNAEGILKSALTLDPRNQSATYLLAQTLLAEGKTDEGKAELEKWKALKGPVPNLASPQ